MTKIVLLVQLTAVVTAILLMSTCIVGAVRYRTEQKKTLAGGSFRPSADSRSTTKLCRDIINSQLS